MHGRRLRQTVQPPAAGSQTTAQAQLQSQHLERLSTEHLDQLWLVTPVPQQHRLALMLQQAASLKLLVWALRMQEQHGRQLQGCRQEETMTKRLPSPEALPRRLATGRASRCELQYSSSCTAVASLMCNQMLVHN